MGNEIMRANCSKKPFSAGKVALSILPTFIAGVIVGLMVKLFIATAFGDAVANVIFTVFLIACPSIGWSAIKMVQSGAILSYVVVFENGIQGKCARGKQLEDFSYTYAELKSVTAKDVNLKVVPKTGKPFLLYADEAVKIAQFIAPKLQ